MQNDKDLRISNLKGILIFLVVFGHFIEIYKYEYYELFVFLYAFHMPLFIFISGYLAKRMRISKIINLVFLYLIFQTFFSIVLYFIGDYPLQFTYGKPHFHLWYIVSLSCWYVIVWLIVKLNPNNIVKSLIFIVLTFISFMSRWYINDIGKLIQVYYENFTSYTLSIQRTLSFIPFFFVGYFMNNKWFKTISNSAKNRLFTIILLSITMFVTFYFVQERQGLESLFRGSFGTHRYMGESETIFTYFILMFSYYILAFWLCYLVINLTSSQSSILTRWGDNSLTVFLFHPIFIFIIRSTEFMETWTAMTKLSVYLTIAIIVTTFLSSKIVIKYTNWLCNPYRTIKSLPLIKRK